MRSGRIKRLIALGVDDSTPDRTSRQLRVSNALALVGVVLSICSIPLDVLGAPPLLAILDVVSTLGFSVALLLSYRMHLGASRVMMLLTANLSFLFSVIEIGSFPGPRTVFFPLVLAPFLVFAISERGWLIFFVSFPVVSYFVTGELEAPPSLVAEVYTIYAPALAFVMLATGWIVFGYVEDVVDAGLFETRAEAAPRVQLVALGEMASGIAHEIRNPLAAIHLAATEIAANPGREAQNVQLGERIQRIVMRAARIIETLRSVSRDASGDPFVVTPVERVVADTLELCSKRISEQGITLTVGTVPAGLAVECRPVQLTQVLMNLVSNAYDAVASAPERWVKIDVGASEGDVELSVTDSGPGIPEAVREHIFEPFFTTKSQRGTGLGLSLSGGLVQAHHGTLELDPTSAHTRFVLRIPRAQPRA